VFLVFRTNRTALLGCVGLLFCFYPADQKGAFSHFWIAEHVVSLGDTLGSHGAIATAGVLLGAMLLAPDFRERGRRLNFTLLFIAGFSAAALLLNRLYGISKNDATPAWCLWSCAVTAALWLMFDYLESSPAEIITRPFRVAGQNVLLAYLLSEMLPNPLHCGGFAAAGLWSEVACSLVWAATVLGITAGLNRIGFRLKI